MTEKIFTRMDAYKINIIELVRHHKEVCNIEDCGVSLFLVLDMCEKLGIKFTKKEKEMFI